MIKSNYWNTEHYPYPISMFLKWVSRCSVSIFWMAIKSIRMESSFSFCFRQYHRTAKRKRRFLVLVKVSTALPYISPLRYLTSKKTVIPSFSAIISISPHLDATKLVSIISYPCLWRYCMARSSARSPMVLEEVVMIIGGYSTQEKICGPVLGFLRGDQRRCLCFHVCSGW